MSDKYKIWDYSKAYFTTLTAVGWIDVFTRKSYKLLLAESIKFCQEKKGLTIFGYCIMPSHIHMIVRADKNISLSDILRDYKKFTAKAIIKKIIDEPESRKDWMLELFVRLKTRKLNMEGYQLWQEGNHPEMVESNKFFDEKLDYIHNNLVRELIVEKPEDYIFSSARNYAGLDCYIDIVIESVKQHNGPAIKL